MGHRHDLAELQRPLCMKKEQTGLLANWLRTFGPNCMHGPSEREVHIPREEKRL